MKKLLNTSASLNVLDIGKLLLENAQWGHLTQPTRFDSNKSWWRDDGRGRVFIHFVCMLLVQERGGTKARFLHQGELFCIVCEETENFIEKPSYKELAFAFTWKSWCIQTMSPCRRRNSYSGIFLAVTFTTFNCNVAPSIHISVLMAVSARHHSHWSIIDDTNEIVSISPHNYILSPCF